jgi:hypothetical protein
LICRWGNIYLVLEWRVSSQEPDSYVRGGGAVHLDGRRVAGYLLLLCELILAVLTVVFTIIAVHHNSRATSLKQKGVAVEVTVTGCVALASGTGITQAGFTCKGSYALAGKRYTENIGGSGAQLAVGQKVAAVAVRDEPTVIYTARSAKTMHSTWTVYITPAVLLAVLAAVELFRRRVGSGHRGKRGLTP